MATVFNDAAGVDNTRQKSFLDDAGGVGVARYDRVRYPWMEKLTEKQLSFFWRPEEVDLTRDSRDFAELTPHEQHVFTANLKRQILLDSVQGRAPSLAFLPLVSIPELEVWVQTWTFSETIHSRSYTHIIRNVYPDPSRVFDELSTVPEIVECADDVSRYYDELIEATARYLHPGVGVAPSTLDLKRMLWRCLHSVNALEGVRFYVSFACAWAFAETRRMEGNAKVIKLIARDENLHLAGTQQLLKALPREDEEWAAVAREETDAVTAMFVSVAEQEKAWAGYLFRDGSMIGLNERLLREYVEWVADKRMRAVGLRSPYKVGSNPLPWTQRWIAGSEVQPAPQEVVVTSYQTGAVRMNANTETFKRMRL